MLFKDIIKLKEFADLGQSTAFESLKTHIKAVEETQLVPVIGWELYNEIDTAYNTIDESDLDKKIKELLEKCREVVGPLVNYAYAPFAEVNISDAGIQRTEGGNAKTAYQNQVTAYREASQRKAAAAIEALYRFLEANKVDYPVWIASDAFKQYQKLFIKTGGEFGELFTSHSPHTNYYAMRPKMYDVEVLYLRRAIGSALFDWLKKYDTLEVKPLLPDGITATDITDVTEKIKKAIAYFTVALSIPFLNVRIDSNGITVIGQGPSNRDADKRKNADNDALNVIVNSSKDAGAQWLDEVSRDLLYWSVAADGNLTINVITTTVIPPVTEVETDQWYMDLSGRAHWLAETYNPRGFLFEQEDENGSFGM